MSFPIKKFMIRQTRAKDLALFYSMANEGRPKSIQEVHFHLLVPSFIISELKTAFEMGFLIYLPFLAIDIIIATVLIAMGMAMVPPAMIGLPIKIMLFVLADGWNILMGSLIKSFL
jgi:flagellar biosynthetic protein FliP